MSKITFKEYIMLKKIDEITNVNSHCADRYLTVEDINDYNGKIIDPNYNKKATRHKMKASEKMLPHIYLNLMLNYLADKPRLRKSIKLSGNPKFSYLIAKNVPYYTMTDSCYLRQKAERMDGLNRMIVNYIHAGIITDTEQIDCARSWFEHSNLEPYEILEKVLED